MTTTHRVEDKTVRMELADIESAKGFFDELREKRSFFLQLEQALKQYERLTIVTTAPPSFDFEFEAEVLQVFPVAGAHGTAFQLCWQPGKSAELHEKLQGGEPG